MVAQACWLVLAVIHAIPALALFQPALLTRLYGLSPGDAGYVLARHRAAFFAVVAATSVWAAFAPAARPVAALLAAASMASFLVLFLMHGRPTALRGVAVIDLVALPALAVAVWSAL